MHDQTEYAHKHNIDDDDNVDYLECGHQSIYWITCEFVVGTSVGNNKNAFIWKNR